MRGLGETIGAAMQIGVNLALGPLLHRWRCRWGATEEEVERALPGDGLVPAPDWSYTPADRSAAVAP